MFEHVQVRVLATNPLPPIHRLQVCVYRAGDASPYHFTEYNHAILTLAGHAVFQEYGGAPFACMPGTVFVIPPRVSYQWHIVQETTLLQCLHQPFTYPQQGELASLYGVTLRHLTALPLPAAEFAALAPLIAHDLQAPATDAGLVLTTDVLRVMAAAATQYNAGRTPLHPVLVRAISYLEGSLDRSVTLGELARHAGMGPSRLSQLFREQLGQSPMQYGARLRAERATKLLVVDGLRAGEVAARLGFASDSYFRRFYKRQTGVPPGQVTNRKKGYEIVI